MQKFCCFLYILCKVSPLIERIKCKIKTAACLKNKRLQSSYYFISGDSLFRNIFRLFLFGYYIGKIDAVQNFLDVFCLSLFFRLIFFIVCKAKP